jgi:hypothetical protein
MKYYISKARLNTVSDHLTQYHGFKRLSWIKSINVIMFPCLKRNPCMHDVFINYKFGIKTQYIMDSFQIYCLLRGCGYCNEEIDPHFIDIDITMYGNGLENK